MDFRNWAVVSFNDDTGLGRQALDMYEYLKLGYFLVVPSEKLSTKPLNSKNHRLLDPKCDRYELSKLLEGIEGLLVLERPHWHANLLSIAKAKGIKIVAIPNWEWLTVMTLFGKNAIYSYALRILPKKLFQTTDLKTQNILEHTQ